MEHIELLLFFFIVAFVYASVGFGGGSSYLAILAMYALPFAEIRLAALLCNIIVVTGGTIIFLRNRQVNWQKIIPLIATSIPMAYLGARLRLSEQVFFIMLGGCLIAAGILLWLKTRTVEEVETVKSNVTKDALYGAGIGFLSGMVGIGGGIFLSPVLNLSRWDTPRKIAATASVFILVNSVSGVAGQLSHLPAQVNASRILFLCIAVLVGGQLGSRISLKRFNLQVIRRVTAILVLVAGVEVLWKHLSF